MAKRLFIWGGVFALLSVVLGALGAHALKAKLTPDSLESFNTGVRFMMFHGLALLVMGLVSYKINNPLFTWACRLLVVGTLCFSGSIYLLSTVSLSGLTVFKSLWTVTPLGGLLLMAGWACFIVASIKINEN